MKGTRPTLLAALLALVLAPSAPADTRSFLDKTLPAYEKAATDCIQAPTRLPICPNQ